MGYKVIDTTADTGIEVWGHNLKELFEEAARGMISIMYDVDKIEEKQKKEIEIKGIDEEDLLISLLNEIIYLKDAEKFLVKRVIIEDIKDKNLKVLLLGETYDPNKHEIIEDIKAATYHNIKILKEKDNLKTKIIFDV